MVSRSFAMRAGGGRADERGRDRRPRDGGGRDRRDGGRDGGRERRDGDRGGRAPHARRRPRPLRRKGLFDWYKFRISHAFVFGNSLAILLVLSIWTFPSYVAYRDRPQFVSQQCLVRSTSNATGCVVVEFLYESDAVCDRPVDAAAPRVDCGAICVASERQVSEGIDATTEAERELYVGAYATGAEVPCFYPKGAAADETFPSAVTFRRPYNPNDELFSAIVWLLPFLLALSVSVACMLRAPKEVEELEDSEMLTGLFEEVMTGRDRQRRFAEEQEQKLKSVVARVEREQEKRLDVVQQVEGAKRDLMYSQDELKHAVSENMRNLESKLVSEMASRLAKIPLPEKLKRKIVDGERGGRERARALDGERPDSAASIYDEHRRHAERRESALEDDIENQRNAFRRRLDERRGRDGRERDPSRKRSKSRNRRG